MALSHRDFIPKLSGHRMFFKVSLSIAIQILFILFSSFLVAEEKIQNQKKASDLADFFVSNDLNISDISIVDVNNDNYLDVFTTNHDRASYLLINQKNNKFSNSITSFGLQVPYSETSLSKNRPGLYIGRVIENTTNRKIIGMIQLAASTFVSDQRRVFLDAQSSSQFKFELDPKGIIKLDGKVISYDIDIDRNFPLSKIYLDRLHVSPVSHKIRVKPYDRHGAAWADYNQDGKLDVFIVSGGMRGNLKKLLSKSLFDSLYVSAGQTYQAFLNKQMESIGLTKVNGCSGYNTAWTDYNSDGKLDIHIYCKRFHKHLLFKQDLNGKFTNLANQAGLNISKSNRRKAYGMTKWLDLNNDQQTDLVRISFDGVELYENNQGSFNYHHLVSKGPFRSASFYDYDLDGDIDILVPSTNASILLENQGKKFITLKTAEIGLPKSNAAMCWLDYNNDSSVDVFSVPHGLYLNLNGKFRKSSNVTGLDQRLKLATCNFFDQDNDGNLNGFIHWIDKRGLAEQEVYQAKHVLKFIEQSTSSYPWLQIKLIGKPGKHTAIGGKVMLEFTDGSKNMQAVGQFDTSRYSQGHFRLYFGLGTKKIKSATVFWPSGKVEVIKKVPTNKLWIIEEK